MIKAPGGGKGGSVVFGKRREENRKLDQKNLLPFMIK